jgi:hypothetical protein
MGSGVSAAAAGSLIGGVSNGATAGAGSSSQATAALLPMATTHIITTGAGNSGVIIPPGNGTTDGLQAGDWMRVANYTGNTIFVYPPVGGKLNNGSLNAGLSMTNGKVATFTSIDGTNFVYELTA